MTGEFLELEIREPRQADAPQLAALCDQLGYPSTAEQVSARLAAITALPDQLVLVAVDPSQTIVGWVHAFVYRVLESDPMVEVGGLVVHQQVRGRGVGKRLLAAVEAWARAQSIGVVSLRSNVVRTEAHAFYRHLGYTVPKTQLVFRKNL